MKKFVLVCLLGVSSIIFGQDHSLQSSPAFSRGDFSAVSTGYDIRTRHIVSSNGEKDVIDGSQYLFPVWNGDFKIFVSPKIAYSIKSLNYNVMSKSLETLIDGDTILKFNPKKIDFISNNSNIFKFYTINNSTDFFQVLFSSNKVHFLKGFDINIVKAYFNPVTQQYEGKDKYRLDYKYFCKEANAEFVEIDLKKKSILKVFGDKSKLVEKYASDLKLSFTSEKDLSKIFQYYDSL